MSTIVQPFEPAEGKKWRVYYDDRDEHGRLRYVLGTITFPEAGGVFVVRTVDHRQVFIYNPVKIEEEFDDHVQ